MKRIVIVGEAPSRSSDPLRPFSGASGRTLAKLAGLSGYIELSYEATLVNVLRRWPGKGFAGEKGSRFPLPRARRAARRMKFEAHSRVILAGKRVTQAFGIRFEDYFCWKLLPRGIAGALVWFACIPHPSGCNGFWNYPENREAASEFFRRDVFEPTGARLLSAGMIGDAPCPE